MAKNNLTVWQRLGKVFGPNSTMDQESPVFKFDKKELLKTTDKKEYENEKLQAQQTMYISKRFIMNQQEWRLIMITNRWNILLKFLQH